MTHRFLDDPREAGVIFRRPNQELEESMEHQDRYVPAVTNGGWPIAAGVVLLAVVCAGIATYVHNKTYKNPTDVTWHAKGQRTAATGH